jgi:single-stranded-DNA-specific exonuclease
MTLLHGPELLPNIEPAAQRLAQAIARREKITLYGDYDVDGMTGTALLWMCLKLLGADVGYHVPHRIDDGYGLSAEAICSAAVCGDP